MSLKKSKRNLALFLLSLAVLIAIITIIYFVLKPRLPYPALAKQRKALQNKPTVAPVRLLDSTALVEDLFYLASDSCEGREPGSPGHENAVQRIVSRFREMGLDSFAQSFIHEFKGEYIRNNSFTGKNIVGWIKGTKDTNRYIVISAHYDHLGIREDKVYYGASDNASGVACILGLARYFSLHPPAMSIVFAAFDREETGTEGALHFVEHLHKLFEPDSIKLNLNIDMITRSDKNELFICGLSHYPGFMNTVKKVQSLTNTNLLMGHDSGEYPDNWTMQSDHYRFHMAGIPFLYAGVEDHEDLHKHTDTVDKIDLSNFIENCNLLLLLVNALMED